MALAFEGFVRRPVWSALGRRLVAIRHPLLLTLSLLATWSARDSADWGLLSAGARGLFGASPLSVYAKTTGLQAGPPSLVVVHALNLLPGSTGLWVAQALLAFAGWYLLLLAERWTIAGATWRSAPLGGGLLTLGVGIPVLIGWSELAGATPHLEDGLAICTAVLALRALALRRELLGALLVGLAIAWKPWAVAALPMTLVCSRKVRALLVAVAVPAVCWLPFLVGDHATLAALGHGFVVQAGSPLRVLGLRHSIPNWWRSVQLLAELAVASLAVRRDWRCAFAAGCAMRLLLDPAGYAYYFAGLLLVTAVTDLIAGNRPWRTAIVWLSVGYPQYVAGSTAVYVLQFGGLAILVLSWIFPVGRLRQETS